MTAEPFTPNTADLLARNRAFAATFAETDHQVAPLRQLAVVTCMDSRIDTFKILGLANGDAHIIRNAGGVITDDVIRSLCASQRLLHTREIVLIHHTDCELQQIGDDDFKHQIEDEIGIKPWWSLESFRDPYDDVRQSIQRLYMTPFVSHKEHIRGFVYDVTNGLLHEVDLAYGGREDR